MSTITEHSDQQSPVRTVVLMPHKMSDLWSRQSASNGGSSRGRRARSRICVNGLSARTRTPETLNTRARTHPLNRKLGLRVRPGATAFLEDVSNMLAFSGSLSVSLFFTLNVKVSFLNNFVSSSFISTLTKYILS